MVDARPMASSLGQDGAAPNRSSGPLRVSRKENKLSARCKRFASRLRENALAGCFLKRGIRYGFVFDL